MAVKTWVWVVVGVVTVLTVGCFAVVGTGVYLASRNFKIEAASETSANDRFEQALARLPNRTPLLILGGASGLRRAERNTAVEQSTQPAAVNALHFLVWDPDDRKMVEFRVPFWLFRLSGSVDVGSDGHFNFEDLKLTPEEVARRGPGLILDHKGKRGERVMMWAE